ncbi:MAG: hypothetical protein IT445_06300 [Phycisphaeraceae bacterium]|nr:hypothetical protein [Phycisphaeraceae bacterium]
MKSRVHSKQRDVSFHGERGVLVRDVELDDGRTYRHRCGLEAYQEVAWYLETHGHDGVTTGDLWRNLPGVASTQATVALDFLKERGCVVSEDRRNYPASNCMYEDAMTEFHALKEEA